MKLFVFLRCRKEKDKNMEQTKQCQNCKQDFMIMPEDFEFYEKIKVSSPTFCPECRMQRRLAFRNERALFRRKCDLCGKDMISMYRAKTPFPVYCLPCFILISGIQWIMARILSAMFHFLRSLKN